MGQTRLDLGKKGAGVGILGTFILFIIKLTVGVIGNSTALITDASHHMSDSLSSVMTHYIGAGCSVDMHIDVDKAMRVVDADRIADAVQCRLLVDVDTINTVLVHICQKKSGGPVC